MTSCSKCNYENANTARFCKGCGALLKQTPTGLPTSDIPGTMPVRTKIGRRYGKPIAIFLLVICIGVYFIFFSRDSNSTGTGSPGGSDSSNSFIQANQLTKPELMIFLSNWQKTQSNKDVISYSRLYSHDFKGKKYIENKRASIYNYKEWINERTVLYSSIRDLDIKVSDIRVSITDTQAVINFVYKYSGNAYTDAGERQLHVFRNGEGVIQISQEEMWSKDEPGQLQSSAELSYTDANGRLIFKSDCFVIVVGSFSYEQDAKKEVARMKYEGHPNAGYLWIPDYPSLSEKQFYATFIGPFHSYGECQNNLRYMNKTGRFWYGIKVSYDSTRIEIR